MNSEIRHPPTPNKTAPAVFSFERGNTMFDLHLFRFEHRGDDIEVVSHGGTAEVYYRKNGGEPQNTYAMFKDDRATFVSPEGKILGYAEAVAFVRSLL